MKRGFGKPKRRFPLHSKEVLRFHLLWSVAETAALVFSVSVSPVFKQLGQSLRLPGHRRCLYRCNQPFEVALQIPTTGVVGDCEREKDSGFERAAKLESQMGHFDGVPNRLFPAVEFLVALSDLVELSLLAMQFGRIRGPGRPIRELAKPVKCA